MLRRKIMKDPQKVYAKEQKELLKRRKMAARHESKYAMIIAFILVVCIHIVDELATNLPGYLQTSIVTEFFVIGKGLEYNEGLSQMSAYSMIVSVLVFFAPFYKTLADRFGRKPFLVMNTAFFGVGMLVCFLAPNYPIYLVGTAIMSFFTAHDMQVTYILEVAPADKRTTFYGTTKCIGTIGLVLVPLFRDMFMGNDGTQWRWVFFIPIFIAFGVSVMAIIMGHETKVFLNQRIEYLEKPIEQREREKAEAKAEAAKKPGIFQAIKYIFKDTKDLRNLVIAMLVYYAGMMGFSSYYESIMTTSGMSTAEVTQALYVYPFVFAGIVLLCGLLGDHLGRKTTIGIMGGVSIIGFILFCLGCGQGWNPYLIGFLYGIYLGCYWQAGDYMQVMVSEKAPTEIRASVTGAIGLLQFFCVIVGMVIILGLMNVLPLSLACLIVATPFIIAGVLIVAIKVKETKGVDLAEAGE